MGFNLQPNARQKSVCGFASAAGGREQRVPEWYLSPGNEVVALNWNKLAFVSVECTWGLLLLPGIWPLEGVGCSVLGYASVPEKGYSALYRSLRSAPVGVGRTENTHTERKCCLTRMVFFGGVKLHWRAEKF